MDLIVSHPSGLYCPPGDFFIDPWRPVDRAVITHGHSDHARFGGAHYLRHHESVPILKRRLGDVDAQGVDYGALLRIDGVEVSLHPAGHVLGSAQIRIQHRGEVWVASGDYKRESDGLCAPFEPQRCNAFITECTFGLPIYRWRPQTYVMDEINAWWRDNAAAGRASVIGAYGLGKAQRILRYLDPAIGPIVCYGSVEPINDIYRACGALRLARGPCASGVATCRAGSRSRRRSMFFAAGSPTHSAGLRRIYGRLRRVVDARDRRFRGLRRARPRLPPRSTTTLAAPA